MTGVDAGVLAAGTALVAVTTPDRFVADVRAAAGAPSVLAVLGDDLDPLSRAQVIAVLIPLAIEMAPVTRLNALAVADGAHPADVRAAAAWLSDAASTTGQLLSVSRRG